MKALALALAILAICGIGYAQEEEKGILNELPGVKQGAAWNFKSDSIMSLTSADIAIWKKKASLGIGGLTDFQDTAIPCLTGNYKIGNLEQFGFEYPLQNWVNIEVGIFGGRDFENKEYAYGVQGSIIKIKL